ncbi:hypothetical protein AVI51_13370 [Piscirickettsia salmonis]|uniref:Type II toxin-antitoxin system HicA family toxin n=1 Tax=Piscirickettsia salmonis TaxID=1238 RepID=A0A9Q6PRQ0_PISSA|nr:type II toxin-antitoxin system HicA family toxin [Piscirickettsia salmonis]RNC78075.1 hypothetical protein DA717_06745 [Piscirickettsiaceae bacterium NZ-RLO2]APS51739.1 hypothetical protein AVI50_13490 [Piscirickettsia salmonis]APS54958.1 hypothetical protein AVI51_13370 [Piscirickettsia salmonis]QGN94002.1 hypothetical protein Psal006a_00573 [Piscirickettsia salmonis]QGO04945.1 hypothetical protein Psal009_00824 [Piscirickettsia salmonis]
MNNKHKKTLREIYTDPIKVNIVWSDVEKMLIAAGATIEERSGSAIAIFLGDEYLGIHRPHPERTTQRYVVKKVRELLKRNGIHA